MTEAAIPVSSKRNLPWVEKYRPQSLDELISHKDILGTINRFVKEDRLPHLLLYGPPGTGKTTTILAVARQIYKTPEDFGRMVLELNASDDRGIGVVRQQILEFASTRSMFSKGYKLIVLDEADQMTKDAQNALRRIIERHTEQVRFCIIANFLSRLIPALQSRCTRFRFAPLARDHMAPRLQAVADAEGLSVSEDGMDALVSLANGDMRRALNVMQSTSMAYDEVTEVNVYTCVGHPLKSDIRNILRWMLNEEFQSAYRLIQELKTAKGLALQDVLTDLHLLVHRIEFPEKIRLELLDRLSEIEYRLSFGTSEKVQLSSMVAAFQSVRERVVKELTVTGPMEEN